MGTPMIDGNHTSSHVPHPGARTAGAVLAARAIGGASRRLKWGGGTALPGLVAERIDPHVVSNLARQLGGGRVIVTGTNGKTTTARMLAGILRAAGDAPVHNRSGSNLMRGLAAALTRFAGPDGRIPHAERRIGVFEVDEATVPQATAAIDPRLLVFTNLFRDQLDRYGEVDSIATLWRQTIARLPPDVTLVLNADDPTVATLAHDFAGRVVYFGVEDLDQAYGSEHAADSRWCSRCDAEFQYSHTFFWHIGHWCCPGCGDRRPTPRVAALRVLDDGEGLRMTLETPIGTLTPSLRLSGLYNAYNALGAATAAIELGVSGEVTAQGITNFTAVFGRQERLDVRGRDVRVVLCKNPAGVNQVLRTILADTEPLRLVLILNDGIADGRDVSWIWDVDFELLRGRTADAIAAGSRSADMALRLKYAGLDSCVEQNLSRAVERAIDATPAGGRLYVLPTYTAMLDVRDLLAGLAGRGHFWNQ
jgi:UDP-N-acetylmuramyl tripeptide synthase